MRAASGSGLASSAADTRTDSHALRTPAAGREQLTLVLGVELVDDDVDVLLPLVAPERRRVLLRRGPGPAAVFLSPVSGTSYRLTKQHPGTHS